MTRTSPSEHALMASGGDSVRRGIVVGPRDELWRGVVAAIHQDSDTHGIYSLDLTGITGAGNPTNGLPGMSLDIGTSAGARDVGTVRCRFYGSDADTVTIAETAPADLPVEVGHHVTARLEFLPWSIPKRIVLTYTAGIITGVTEYLDYDLPYPGGANPYPPKANITAGHHADGTPKPVLPYGYEDTPGCGFRTVHLSALDSVVHNPGATLGTPLWYLFDGVIINGGSVTDLEIDVQFPLGSRYIHLLLPDSLGAQDILFRHMPLICDNQANPQFLLRDFKVTADQTDADRELQFEFGPDAANAADETVIPKLSLIIYVEEPEWNDGDMPPESYRCQSLGWVTDDNPLLKLEESTYGIKVGSTQHWKQSFQANSITFTDTGFTPTTYTEVRDFTVDRALDFSLRAADTLRSLVNVYYSGISAQDEALTLPLGDAWTQVTSTAPRAYMAQATCDELGNIQIKIPYDYLSAGQQTTWLIAMELTNADWTDAEGLTLPATNLRKVGVVNAAAELWDGGSRILYASQAPGLRSGYGTGQAKLPDQFVQAPTPQADLNRLTGADYWNKNNPYDPVPLPLAGNMDAFRVGDVLLATWTDDTIRGTQLLQVPFIVRSIAVEHTNEPDESTPPKKITLTVQRFAAGGPGETAPVLQMEGVTQIPDTTCDLTAAFTFDDSTCLVAFTDTSAGDLLYAWLWDFGDGSFSVERNPSHGYAEPGTYTVTEFVANECGAYDSISHDVTVSAETVTAGFTSAPSALIVTFTDTSSADSGIVGWLWNFGDGETSTEQNPVHTYAASDTYSVSLTVTSACGNSDTHSDDVTVSSDVDWCHFGDFESGTDGMSITHGSYVPGTGYQNQNVTSGAVELRRTFTATTFHDYEITFDIGAGSGASVDGTITFWLGGVQVISGAPGAFASSDNSGSYTRSKTGFVVTCDEFRVNAHFNGNPGSRVITLKTLQTDGHGLPYDGINC